MPRPAFVLVPGAFHGPSAWHEVAEHLRAQGYKVLTPALATASTLHDSSKIAGKTSLDDMQSIHEHMLPELDKGAEVVLVGHSYGSLPATLAVQGQTVDERKARGLPGGIREFVVLTGFAFPVRGKSIMGDDNDPPVPDYFAIKDGVCRLEKNKAMETLYSDLPEHKRDEAWASIYPAQSRASLCAFPQFLASDITIPKTWILTEKDQAIDAASQEAFVQFGKFDNTVRVDAGHMANITATIRVADVLLEIGGRDI